MTASFIDQITDEMIQARLDSITGASAEWMGHMPRDAERIDTAVCDRALALTVSDVREQLTHDIHCDSPDDGIMAAISMAAEVDGMPENGSVNVFYLD